MTADRIPALLEPIQNRLNAATPGPWAWDGHARRGLVNMSQAMPILQCAALLHPERANADFIANAPTDQARLLAAIQAVVGEIADTDLETNEAQQGDLADRILAAVVAALGGEASV